MKPPERLRQANDDIAYTIGRWPAFITALRDRTPDGYGTATDSGPGGGISNPTPAAVNARERWVGRHEEAETLVLELSAKARRLAQIMTSVGGEQPAQGQRCTGAPDQPWGDATCVNNAVRAGLCWKCIKRGQRWHEDNIGSYT